MMLLLTSNYGANRANLNVTGGLTAIGVFQFPLQKWAELVIIIFFILTKFFFDKPPLSHVKLCNSFRVPVVTLSQ